MEKRKISSLGLRIISSLVMVPLVVGAVYFGNPYLFLLLLLTGAMLCWEWSSMIKSANPALYATIYTVCMVISVLFPLSLLWLIIILFAGILAAYKARKEAHPVLLALGVPYIALGLGSIAWIYQVTDWVGIMWLILAGIEWDVTKHLTLSCGGQITDYGLSDNYQSDTSFSCDSYTLGFGAKLNLTERAALNVGYMWTTYEDYTKKSQNYNNTGLSGTNIYSRTNKVFGASINYRF